MSEEIKNIEMGTENTEDVTVYEMEPETSGGGLVKILAVVGLGVAAAGAALWHKNKDKIEEKNIEKLRKKGYLVYKADEVEVREVEDADGFEDVDETEEEEK